MGQTSQTRPARFVESLVSMSRSVWNVFGRLTSWVIRSWQSKHPLSQTGCSYSSSLPSSAGSNPQPRASAQLPMYLLACINTKRHRARLVQIPVSTDSRDGNVFEKLRSHYFRVRGWRSVLTLRTVESLRFVKVETAIPACYQMYLLIVVSFEV